MLSMEKTTEQIEKERLQDEFTPLQESDDPNNPESQILKLKVKTQISMRQIKKRLQKEYYENMDQVCR